MSRRRKENSEDIIDLDELEKVIQKRLVNMPIEEELKKDFVLYANEINLFRAFPYVLSGLKPVAAHALWAMWYNKRIQSRPYTKSAKVNGEVMSFSPHGDSYGSLVRLAQNFVYHVPYIDGHGSFGSVVGGPTAGAMRYTEMRSAAFAEDTLFYNTNLLDMGLNYLEEDPEPLLDKWVSLLPLLFITNTSGMGFTVSNTWSSGNLYEFREQLGNYIKTGKVDCSNLYPDFPTGGLIINKSEMKSLYETGKGTIKLRGNVEIEDNVIKILSLPYGEFPENFMEDIKDYVTKTPNNTIVEVSDRCDKKGFLIEVECEPGTAEYVLEVLYRKTCLQISISDEHKAVTPNGKVELVTFPDYMRMFAESNIELVKKEATFNINKINDRLEILEGLLSALEIIDKIIAEIKKSKSMEDAKITVMNLKFKGHSFTERQADAIVHTPLGRLANLEQIKLQDEKNELEKQKADWTNIKDNRKAQEKYFLKRFDKLLEKYGWERKTQVEDIEMVDIRVATEKPTKLKTKKEFMIVLTSENCLKRVDVMKFRASEEDSKVIKVSGNQKIVLISNKGQMYKVWSNQVDKCLPTASGTEIKSIRPEIGDEKILGIYSEDVELPYIYYVTKEGFGKMGEVRYSIGLSKQIGTIVCGLKSDTDEIISIKLLKENEKIEITTNNRTEVIDPGKPQGRGSSGKRVINLKKGEEITDVHSVS